MATLRTSTLILCSLLALAGYIPAGAASPAHVAEAKYRPGPTPVLSYTAQQGQSLRIDVLADLSSAEKGLSIHSVDRPRLGVAVVENGLLYYIPTLGPPGRESFHVRIARRSGLTFAVQLDLTVVPAPPPPLRISVLNELPPNIVKARLTLHAGTAALQTVELVPPHFSAEVGLPHTVPDGALVWVSVDGIDAQGSAFHLRALSHSAGAHRSGEPMLNTEVIRLNTLSSAAFVHLQRMGLAVTQSAADIEKSAQDLDPEAVLRSAAVLDSVHRQGCCVPPGFNTAYEALLDDSASAWLQGLFSSEELDAAERSLLEQTALPLDVWTENPLRLRRAGAPAEVRTDDVFGLELSREPGAPKTEVLLPWRRSVLSASPLNEWSSRGHRQYRLDEAIEYTAELPMRCGSPWQSAETRMHLSGLRGWRLVEVLGLQLARVDFEAWPIDWDQPLPPGCTLDFDFDQRQRHYLIGSHSTLQQTGTSGLKPSYLHVELPTPEVSGTVQAAHLSFAGGGFACVLDSEGYDTHCNATHRFDESGEWRGLRLLAYTNDGSHQHWEFEIELLRDLSDLPQPSADARIGEWQIRSHRHPEEWSAHTSIGAHGWWEAPVVMASGWMESSDTSARVGRSAASDWRGLLNVQSAPRLVVEELQMPGPNLAPAAWQSRPVTSRIENGVLRMESYFDALIRAWLPACSDLPADRCQLGFLREWQLLDVPLQAMDSLPDSRPSLLVRERLSQPSETGGWISSPWRLKVYRNHGWAPPQP